jgi:hypothetical protein
MGLSKKMEPTGIEPVTSTPQGQVSKGDTHKAPDALAYSLACETQFCHSDRPAVDADLARVMAAWAKLPGALQAGILAMVRAAGG